MGAFSIWHGLILLLLLGCMAGGVGLVVWLAIRVGRGAGDASSQHASASRRLQVLDDLRAKGLVSEAEYQKQRAVIVREI